MVSMRFGKSRGTENVIDPALLQRMVDSNFVLKETGTFTISAKSAGTTTDVEIEFTEEYSSAPRIIVVGNNTSASVYGLPALVENSTTGATVKMRSVAAHSYEASFRWFAIETM